MTMSSPSDREVIGRSLGEPEAFGLIYDRHAATLPRFLGRRAADARASAAALDARLLFPRVADAIEALPDDEREALLLFAWEELSYQGVAEALELPIGTVRSRLNRARARLRELLEPNGKSKVR